MLQYMGLDWIAMAFTFSAIYLLGNKNRHGFIVMMIGNLCWTGIAIWVHSYGMLLANVGFLAMNLRGYMKWTTGEISEEK